MKKSELRNENAGDERGLIPGTNPEFRALTLNWLQGIEETLKRF